MQLKVIFNIFLYLMLNKPNYKKFQLNQSFKNKIQLKIQN